MWRAFFLALGIFACILGAECMVIDSFVMAGETKSETPTSLFNAPPPSQPRVFTPAEWAPWTLLSTGAVVILYSLTLNKP